MAIMRAVKTVKYRGRYYAPGEVLKVTEKKIVEYLKDTLSAVCTQVEQSLTPAQLLMEVGGVDEKIATILIKNDIDTVEKLGSEKIEDLIKLGIPEKTAGKIFGSFED